MSLKSCNKTYALQSHGLTNVETGFLFKSRDGMTLRGVLYMKELSISEISIFFCRSLCLSQMVSS